MVGQAMRYPLYPHLVPFLSETEPDDEVSNPCAVPRAFAVVMMAAWAEGSDYLAIHAEGHRPLCYVSLATRGELVLNESEPPSVDARGVLVVEPVENQNLRVDGAVEISVPEHDRLARENHFVKTVLSVVHAPSVLETHCRMSMPYAGDRRARDPALVREDDGSTRYVIAASNDEVEQEPRALEVVFVETAESIAAAPHVQARYQVPHGRGPFSACDGYADNSRGD